MSDSDTARHPSSSSILLDDSDTDLLSAAANIVQRLEEILTALIQLQTDIETSSSSSSSSSSSGLLSFKSLLESMKGQLSPSGEYIKKNNMSIYDLLIQDIKIAHTT